MTQWLPLTALSLAVAFVLDLLLGDPPWLYHPVRIIGAFISWLERVLRRIFPATPRGERAAGIPLAVLPPLLSTAVCAGILWLAARIHWGLWFALETFFCYQMLAVRSLRDESMRVYGCLHAGDLPAAREALSHIVGRDTGSLSGSEVARAAVECVAESTNDGIVAPLFYAAIGGAPLLFCYKAVNTLDSMVGYKNDRYLHLGRASARLDDVWGYLPARLSGWLMIIAAWLTGLDARGAARIYQRDRRNHASPNSAHTEAACAGALQIQLGGDAYYFGKLKHKPTIGDPVHPTRAQDIPHANRLMVATSVLCVLLFCALRAGLAFLLR